MWMNWCTAPMSIASLSLVWRGGWLCSVNWPARRGYEKGGVLWVWRSLWSLVLNNSFAGCGKRWLRWEICLTDALFSMWRVLWWLRHAPRWCLFGSIFGPLLTECGGIVNKLTTGGMDEIVDGLRRTMTECKVSNMSSLLHTCLSLRGLVVCPSFLLVCCVSVVWQGATLTSEGDNRPGEPTRSSPIENTFQETYWPCSSC